MTFYKVTKSTVIDPEKPPVEYSSSCEFPGGVIYKVDEWVSAPPIMQKAGYDLFVFSNLNYLRDFLTGFDERDYNAWEIEVQGLHGELPMFLSPYTHNIVLQRGKIPDYLKDDPGPIFWPGGTIMVDKVKLIRRIKWTP